MYDVGGTLYTLNGNDVWECMSFQQTAGKPGIYWFVNMKTGETKRGTIDELPNFQEVSHVSEVADAAVAYSIG